MLKILRKCICKTIKSPFKTQEHLANAYLAQREANIHQQIKIFMNQINDALVQLQRMGLGVA